MLNWVENGLLANGLKYWAHSCYKSLVKLRRENTQPENMCNNVYEKAKRRAGKVTERVFMQKQPSEGFFKKDV